MTPSGHGRADLVRLFVALDLNEAVRQAIADEQARLKKVTAGVKWVPPELIHLTLVFLGDVFAEQVEGIVRVLDTAAGASPAFPMEIAGLGFFGPRHCPRVIWAGVGKGADQVVTLAARISTGLRGLNLSLESRPFHPHLTLGRVKSAREAEGIEEALSRSGAARYGEVAVDGVLLMRSELLPQGPVYRVMHKASLLPHDPP
ncbi:MAG: RNA 2',3'-cyclic phosphodiesterase [bacterium]